MFLTYSRNNPLKKFTCHNCYYSVDELNPLISKYGGVYLAGKKGLFYIHASTRHLKSFIKWKWYLKKMKVGIFENIFCANTFIQGDIWWVWNIFGRLCSKNKSEAIVSNLVGNAIFCWCTPTKNLSTDTIMIKSKIYDEVATLRT